MYGHYKYGNPRERSLLQELVENGGEDVIAGASIESG